MEVKPKNLLEGSYGRYENVSKIGSGAQGFVNKYKYQNRESKMKSN
jgi:hypothetical protein